MADAYQSTYSLPTRRAVYSFEEDKSMWDFFVQKVRKRSPDALARRASLWAEYAMTCNTNRTYHTLEKHFRNILLPRIDSAPIEDEDVMLILELCEVRLADNDSQRNLKRRLRKLCELSIVCPSLFVQRVTRLEKKSRQRSSAVFDSPDHPPPIFVRDTQPSPSAVNNKIIKEETQDDGAVDESFRCVDPDQCLGDDQGYLKFIQEVTSERQQPQPLKLVQPKQSPKKLFLGNTVSWSNVTSGEYLMDLSTSPVRLKALTEETSEDNTYVYETAPSQPATPSTNSSPTMVPDSEHTLQLFQSNGTPLKKTLSEEEHLYQKASTSSESIDRATQIELEWHKQLTQKNADNRGLTPMEVLQSGIPENVKEMVAEACNPGASELETFRGAWSAGPAEEEFIDSIPQLPFFLKLLRARLKVSA